jgi:hypothetical protein
VPFPLRVFGWLGLLVARVAVWASVGIVVPLFLTLLSFLFGSRLRDAARACHAASARAEASMSRASERLSGEEDTHDDLDEDAEAARVRIAGEDILRSVRAVTPEQAQREAIRAAERSGRSDAEEWAARVATEEAERWEPPEAWREREEEEAKRKAAKRRS